MGDTHRCLALDLPGTGDTVLPDALRTMGDLSRWVAESCRALGLTQITLIGHSLGGNLAAQTALDFPDLVMRLVLVDAALDADSLPRRAFWALHPRIGLPGLGLVRLASWPLGTAGRIVPHAHRGGYWLPYARRTHLYATRNTDRALQRQMHALAQNSLTPERLAGLTLPLLIVHGARDAIIPLHHAKGLAQALPQAKLVVFPTAHHCPMDTDPARFADTLRDFLV